MRRPGEEMGRGCIYTYLCAVEAAGGGACVTVLRRVLSGARAGRNGECGCECESDVLDPDLSRQIC